MTRETAKVVLEALEYGAQVELPELLEWIADRLVLVYDENPNIDFVQTLRTRAKLCRKAIDRIRKEAGRD